MAKNSLQKLIEAGVQFGEMSRKQAEDAGKKLVKDGDVRRSEAEATVQSLLERGRATAIAVAEAVQGEVTKQLGWLASRVDEMEDQLESVVSRLTPTSTAPATTTPAKRAPAKRAPAKRANAKKATAKKKAPAKRA